MPRIPGEGLKLAKSLGDQPVPTLTMEYIYIYIFVDKFLSAFQPIPMRGPLIYRPDRGVLHFTTFRRENVSIFFFYQDAFERWIRAKRGGGSIVVDENKVYTGKKDEGWRGFRTFLRFWRTILENGVVNRNGVKEMLGYVFSIPIDRSFSW